MVRGRRKGSNGQISKSLILQAAAQTFAEYGYFQTKISTIVKRANMTQPTFYLYFKSKEAIFKELDRDFQQNVKEMIHSSLLGEGLQSRSLEQMVAAKLEMLFTYFDKNWALTSIGLYLSPRAEITKKEVAELIAANLHKEKQIGYFRSALDMQMVANSLIGIIVQLVESELFTGAKTAQVLSKEVTDLLLYGVFNYNRL